MIAPPRPAWHPLRLARLAVPLFIILVLSALDKQPGIRLLLHMWQQPAHYGTIVLNLLLGLYVVHTTLGIARALLWGYLGPHHARSATKFVGVVLYGVVAAFAVTAAGFNLSGLFVGGALTGIILGVAAQASLSNLIAGVVLLFARPYAPGASVRLTLDSTTYQGHIQDMGLFYTTLRNGQGRISVPNSTMVAAVLVLPEGDAEH